MIFVKLIQLVLWFVLVKPKCALMNLKYVENIEKTCFLFNFYTVVVVLGMSRIRMQPEIGCVCGSAVEIRHSVLWRRHEQLSRRRRVLGRRVSLQTQMCGVDRRRCAVQHKRVRSNVRQMQFGAASRRRCVRVAQRSSERRRLLSRQLHVPLGAGRRHTERRVRWSTIGGKHHHHHHQHHHQYVTLLPSQATKNHSACAPPVIIETGAGADAALVVGLAALGAAVVMILVAVLLCAFVNKSALTDPSTWGMGADAAVENSPLYDESAGGQVNQLYEG